MTVLAQTPRNQYVGNGAQTVYSYGFEIVADADIAVYVGTVRQTLTTHYTVSGAGNNSGGSITFLSAPANGAIVTFRRDMSYARSVDFQQGGAAFASNFNADSDRNTLAVQQIQEQVNRTLRLGPGSQYQGENLEIGESSADRINKVLGFDGDGDITLLADMATEQFVLDNISASGGGTVLSVNASGGTTGLTFTGGPVTNSGTLTLSGTLAVANGGTGTTTSTGTGSTVRSASPALTGTPTVPTQTAGDSSTAAASTAFVATAVAAAVPSPIRQTISAGPVTTAGLPSFLPSTSGSLGITSQNVTSTYPFVATAANGWLAATGQPVNRLGYSSANLTWSGLAASSKNFLFVTVNTNGTLTPGSTTLAPVYQFGGTPSTTNNQFTFNIAEMRAYLGNGSVANAAYMVFVGEADTNGTTVTATIAYAYNGRYESAWTAGIWNTSTAVSASHNLGVYPRLKDFILECTTTDNGYAVGDQIAMSAQTLTSAGVGIYHPHPLACNRFTMRTYSGPTNAFVATHITSGSNVNLTQASWKYKAVADRGW